MNPNIRGSRLTQLDGEVWLFTLGSVLAATMLPPNHNLIADNGRTEAIPHANNLGARLVTPS